MAYFDTDDACARVCCRKRGCAFAPVYVQWWNTTPVSLLRVFLLNITSRAKVEQALIFTQQASKQARAARPALLLSFDGDKLVFQRLRFPNMVLQHALHTLQCTPMTRVIHRHACRCTNASANANVCSVDASLTPKCKLGPSELKYKQKQVTSKGQRKGCIMLTIRDATLKLLQQQHRWQPSAPQTAQPAHPDPQAPAAHCVGCRRG